MSGRMTLSAAAIVLAGLLSSCNQGYDYAGAPVATRRGVVGGGGGVYLSERRHPKVPGEVEPAWSDPADAAEAAKGAEEVVIGPPPIDRPDPYRVRSGDVLAIDVLGEDDMRREVPVGPDGRIDYYVAHGVQAAGRTLAEIRVSIARRLRTHFKSPQVSVGGRSYSGSAVAVLGMVARPGRYEVRNDTRLLDAIAEAGGVRVGWPSGAGGVVEMADLARAYLLRDGKFVGVDFASVFRGSEQQVAQNNVRLRPGDRIYLPPRLAAAQRVAGAKR